MAFSIGALVFVILMVLVIGLHPPGYVPGDVPKPPKTPEESHPEAEANKKPQPAGKPQDRKPKS